MKEITVLTPTYNRVNTLPRVYDSLIKQSNQNFRWLIVDDGSTDDTEIIVNKWIKEKKIEIEYYKIKKGGQHKALQLGYHIAKTKYLIKIDSDDAFILDAIDIFINAWIKAEHDNMSIGNITALSLYDNGKLDGNWNFPDGVEYLDSNWHEMVLKKKNNNELSNCTLTNILKEIYPYNYKFWQEDKINIIDGVFAPRISQKCVTRYLNTAVQIVYTDAPFSSLRSMISYSNKFMKVIIDNKYFLDENLDYFFWNPRYFIHLILKFIISGIEERYSPVYLLKNINSSRFKVAYCSLWPLGFSAWVYYKYIKRSFWF
jgi:glycosyltransferase involved in cell wall biosynthesis